MDPSNIDLPETVTLHGIPYDAGSSYLRGAAKAPQAIRRALHSASSTLCCESGLAPGDEPRLIDAGDIELESGSSAWEQIEAATTKLLTGTAQNGGSSGGALRNGNCHTRLLTLGGDHSISYPILRAHAKSYESLDLLQLDAHPDLYDALDGNRLSHACPFARIMEDGLVARLIQVGIRTLNPHQRAQAERFGVEIVEMRTWSPEQSFDFRRPLYLSLDLDVLDPAFAPGVSHHEPGGLSTREVIGLIQSLQADIVGADIVELNPDRDPTAVTAMVAAKLLKEIADRMLSGPVSTR